MDKTKFTKAIMYLTTLKEEVEKINKEYGVDDNDILYYHYFDGDGIEQHYQYVCYLRPTLTLPRQPWELNIYIHHEDGTKDKTTYAGSTPKELLANIEAGIIYKE